METSGKIKSLLHVAAVLIFVIYLFFSILGFSSLRISPYTGLTIMSQDHRAVVTNVEDGGPAHQAGIKPGDVLDSLDGNSIPHLAFAIEADHLSSRKDQRLFWDEQKKLQNRVTVGKQMNLVMMRGKSTMMFSIVPAVFPIGKALIRTVPIFIVGWTFFIVSYLVLRKKYNEISVANFIVGVFGGLVSISFPSYSLRDLVYPTSAFQILAASSHIALTTGSFACIHLMLVFPTRKKILEGRPWLIPGIYVIIGFTLLAEAFGLFEYAHLTTYVPISVCLIFFNSGLIYSFLTEKNLVYKKQIQWVCFSFLVGITWTLMTIIAIMLKRPLVSGYLAALPAVVIPISFAFAISRYRLMDIEEIVDNTVIYGATIIVLEIAEIALLSVLSPFFEIPYVSLFGVLLIVFLYHPIRCSVKKFVERAFKRGVYDPDEEIQRFIIGLGSCDEVSALDKFSSFVQQLLGPSGVFVVCLRPFALCAHTADKETGRLVMETAKSSLSGLRGWFSNKPAPCFGFELTDSGGLTGAGTIAQIESSLFIPFFVDQELSHVAVLLPKQNGKIYSKRDLKLLNAVAVDITHVLAAEERRRELEAERMRLAREIHDGVSSEFTGILSYSERGALQTGDGIQTRDLFEKIEESSRRGIAELRNVIWALNPEKQSLGYMAAFMRRYVTDFLSAAEVNVTMNELGRDDELVIQSHTSLVLFRIVQELSHNVLKHSGADSLHIELRGTGNSLSLEFDDNGKGFNHVVALECPGHGLKNMKRRVEEEGGQISFISSPVQGTSTKVILPL